jgi:hypothetical protein
MSFSWAVMQPQPLQLQETTYIFKGLITGDQGRLQLLQAAVRTPRRTCTWQTIPQR